MVVVLPVVESDELHLEKRLDLARSRVHHSYDRLRSLSLPAADEEVRIYLEVEEDHTTLGITVRLLLNIPVLDGLGLKLQTKERGDTCVALMSGLHGECHDLWTQISQVVHEVRRICVIQDLLDEIHRRLGAGMDLFTKVSDDEVSKSLLRRDLRLVQHLFLLSERKTL